MDLGNNMKTLAATPLGQIGGQGLGPFGQSAGDGLTGITSIVSSIIGIMTIAAGIWFLFQFVIGGFNWINSGGDKAKLQTSKDKLTNAFIGLIVVVAGWAILALAGTFFNVDFTISNPSDMLRLLSPNQ